MKEISLNTDWQLSYCDINEWDISNFNSEREREQTMKCTVPGAVHLALKDANIIKEPLEKLNMLDCKFVEEKDFWHTVTFQVEEDFIKDKVVIYFDGVDVNASYYLNNSHLGDSNNAFYCATFDITDKLCVGENCLVVRVNEGVQAVKAHGKSIDYMEFSWNQEEPYRTYLRKPQFCYGWDWAKRLTTCGIYKSVSIKSYEKAYLNDIYITNEVIDNTANIQVKFDVCSTNKINNENYKIRYTVSTDSAYETKKVVSQGEQSACNTLSVEIDSPKLWWCNGYGDAYLYNIVLELLDNQGNVLDTKEQNYGIRTITIEKEPISTDVDKTFTFVLNGKKIYAKGANWVPVDQIIGRISAQRYETLVQCAVDMNMNMFRVWGGGFYEGDDFFNSCDKHGIMVWHDFMFACGYYPDFDEEFVENVIQEAIYQVKDKRNRASFVGWSGNNENYSMYEGHVKNIEKKFPFYGKKIYEEVLANACGQFDPQREYRLSSPYGGAFADDLKEGDQHFWGAYHSFSDVYNDFFRIADSKASFVSEFGMIAPFNLETLKKCCDEEECVPQSEQWLFHSNSGDNFETLIEDYFGISQPSKSVAIDKYILMGQAIQAEVIKYAFEKYRSEKFLCSGTLFWMYSDCYPTSGWCFVDYYYNKKPLYYYTKKAFAPVAIFFNGYNPNAKKSMAEYKEYYSNDSASVDVTVISDCLCDLNLNCTIDIMKLDGTKIDTTTFDTTVTENTANVVYKLDLNKYISNGLDIDDTVIVCTVKDENAVIAQNRYFLAPYKNLMLQKAKVICTKEQKEGYVELTIKADTYVWLCHLPHNEGESFDNNDFDLIPNQEVKVKVFGKSVDEYIFNYLTMNDCR